MFYQLNVSMGASMESVLVPTNASVFLDILERHAIKVSIRCLVNMSQVKNPNFKKRGSFVSEINMIYISRSE